MKSENGLTFFGTVILVVIIALVVFGVVYFTRMQVDKEKAEDIKTDMLLVQAKVKTISGNYILEDDEDILVGTKLSEIEEEQPIKEFLEKGLFDPDEKNKKYYVLNQQNLEELELNKVILEENSYYIVEYTSSEVYYTKGYLDENGEVHYKVDEQTEETKSEENSEEE